MITAEEAFQLVEGSDHALKQKLDEIDKQIREAANTGLRILKIFHNSYDCLRNIRGMPNEFRQVADELRSLKFRVAYEPHDSPYVPRGLANDDGTGQLHQNYYLVIRW